MVPKYVKKREVAKLVTENRQPCVFCSEDVDDEVIFGKLYSYGDIQCHYFCVLLSCCLVQKGRDTEGLFGFLYKDILAEVERSKKHKCSYCGRGGASLGCSVASCRKQFHLPCGRRKNAVSLFYGNYKSFCELHAPKQKISEDVMAKAKGRIKIEKLKKAGKLPVTGENQQAENSEDPSLVCVICYEEVQAYPTTQTFWPPCCGRDAWLHRTCLQRMALSAGMHYLKCPLCNDKEVFYDAVCQQGYYLPDRDAAWELEQNAFAEIYNRESSCAAPECKCPFGRAYDEYGMWDVQLCLLCGSWGMHAFCSGGERPLCASCRPAAADIEQLETRLAAARLAEQVGHPRRARGPRMPARMSLRRTKGRSACSSSQVLPTQEIENKTVSQTSSDTSSNLKTPKPKLVTPNLRELEAKLLSPIKMLEQTYLEKGGGRDMVVPSEVLETIRLKFSKPKPLSAKKKIVNEILDDLFKNVFKENAKSKDPVREWNSPKKSCDVTNDMNEAVKKVMKPLFNTNTSISEENKVPEDTEQRDLSAIEENTNNNKAKDENHESDRDIITRDTSDIDENSSDKENNINREDNFKDESDGESSTSTFVMPSEFVAESNDEDSSPIIDTPKKLKTVDIKRESIEISKNNEVVNIDVIKTGTESPVRNKIIAFKFSPLDNEPFNKDVDMDVESFKDQYLNEVDKDKGQKHDTNVLTGKKRKLDAKEDVRKKRKRNNKKRNKIKLKIALDTKLSKRKKKIKEIKDLRKKMVREKLGNIKRELKKNKSKKKVKSYKQYVLKYSLLEQNVIAKPDVDVTPMKRKYNKVEKSPTDNLVQTSIQSFFKTKEK